jgi:hypothetical protein
MRARSSTEWVGAYYQGPMVAIQPGNRLATVRMALQTVYRRKNSVGVSQGGFFGALRFEANLRFEVMQRWF